MKKKAFILAVNPFWTGISRLPFALKRAQFEVLAYCPSNSYLAQSDSLNKCYPYLAIFYSRTKLFYLTSLWHIIKTNPDIIIPGDEESILVLQRIANFCEGIPFLDKIHRIIRISLYPKEMDNIILHKELFIQKCHEWGVRAPKNIIVNDINDAMTKVKEFDFPVVLKISSGYGGHGVSICHCEEEIKSHLQNFFQQSLFQKIKFFLKKLFFISLDNEGNKFSLQQFIKGTVGMCPFTSLNGEILAANAMIKYRTYPGETGPSSVTKSLNDPEIISFARTMAKNLKYNGFGSIEFILNEKDNKAYLIETNPRPVPVSHFDSKIANDLAVCLGLAVRGSQVPPFTYQEFTVALYPNELRRDPNSEFIKEAYHDVPNEEPRLREALLNKK